MKKSDKPIIVEHLFPLPDSAVWKAITDPQEMRQWYFEFLTAFQAQPGFKTQFTISNEGRTFTHLWEITEVIPFKKIACRWEFAEYPGEGLVVFEVFKKEEVTRLRLTSTVIKNFPDDIPEFKRESGVAGWNYFIKERLKEYLAKRQNKPEEV